MQIKAGDKVLVRDRNNGEIAVCRYSNGAGKAHLVYYNNQPLIIGTDKRFVFVCPNTPKLKAMLEGAK